MEDKGFILQEGLVNADSLVLESWETGGVGVPGTETVPGSSRSTSGLKV